MQEMFRIAREVVVLDEQASKWPRLQRVIERSPTHLLRSTSQAFVPRYEGWWDQASTIALGLLPVLQGERPVPGCSC